MPIYQYRCESCGSLWEDIRNLTQRDAPFACRQCSAQCVRNQFPAAPVALKRQQKDSGRQEQKAQGSEGPTAISVQGPTKLTISNSVFRGLSRGVVAHPQAQISIKKSRFHNVKVPVERRKE